MSSPHLLNLPPELHEHILAYLCHESAQTIPACRQTCRALDAAATHSVLVRYLERAALHGVYDPLVDVDGTPLPVRAAALEAWDEAWGKTLERKLGGRERPDMEFVLPSREEIVQGAVMAKVTSSIQQPEEEADEDEDEPPRCHYSFGPWFIAAAREGYGVRAGYSYLDMHGCLGGGDPRWKTINVPLRDVVVFALSTELDLAVAISAKVERGGADGEKAWTKSEMEVRPLRFRDGTPHPCAKVETICFTVSDASAHNMAQAQVLGDYLLLWIGGPSEDDFSLCKLYAIAWKQGSVTLLRENPPGKYGPIPCMISEDVFALVQLDPPGIELCRISNLTVTAGMADGGPRMDKLCTLLLAPLQHGARADWAVCVGEHPGHQSFSRGPWPEYRGTAPRRQFRQSPSESIMSVVMQITGSEGHVRIFDMVVRCATLLAHAAAASALSSTNGMENMQVRQRWVEGREDDKVPWAAWGPRATSVSDHTHVGANDLLGERRATIDLNGHRVRINDYNPYRIRQAVEAAAAAAVEASKLAEDPRRSVGGPQSGVFMDVDGDELNGARQNGIRRITETSTVVGGEWFREEVTTSLPYLEITVYVPRCRGLYMEQDQLLLHVDALNAFTGRPSGRVEGFLLYRM